MSGFLSREILIFIYSVLFILECALMPLVVRLLNLTNFLWCFDFLWKKLFIIALESRKWGLLFTLSNDDFINHTRKLSKHAEDGSATSSRHFRYIIQLF